MSIDVLIEGEGLSEVQVIPFPLGTPARAVIERVLELAGHSGKHAMLFREDEEQPVGGELARVDETWSRVVHHVHRVHHVSVVIFYNGAQREHLFSPATRVQRVLDWAVGASGFGVDPVIAPEMDLARRGREEPLPRNAHIGRYVSHPEDRLDLDLIRGIVPNGAPA